MLEVVPMKQTGLAHVERDAKRDLVGSGLVD